MSKYADVFLLPLRETAIPAYRKLATAPGKPFVKHGALKYREYVASDLNVPGRRPVSEEHRAEGGRDFGLSGHGVQIRIAPQQSDEGDLQRSTMERTEKTRSTERMKAF